MTLATLAACVVAALAAPEQWTKPEEVLRGTELVVAYRARLDGDLLIVEARHNKPWHTYALDNPQRAKAAGGNTELGLELPTRIAVSGGLQVAGPWYQSEPLDLSDMEIGWRTWGFDEEAIFAARVTRGDGEEATLTIDAQACSDSACRMVDRLVLSLPLPEGGLGESGYDLSTLVKVEPASEQAAE